MKVLIAGDYVPRDRLAPIVECSHFDTIFGEIRPILSRVDYSIVNFESPIVKDGDKPISKFGPNLKCTEKAVDAIKYAGFNCVTLANNHIRDYGDVAIQRTISTLNSQDIDHVGAGKDLIAASSILYHENHGERLAIINFCENEFSIASKFNYGANPLNVVKLYYLITEAKENADFVLVICHGGHEHYQLPSPRMQDLYRYFIDIGADFVVNHHQHCFSGYEIYKERLIFYGLGNFCMDKNPIKINQPWNFGYMVILDTSNLSHFEIIPYEQCGKEPGVHLINCESFNETLAHLNKIISDREALEAEIRKYYYHSSSWIQSIFEPIQNRFLLALQRRKLFPSLLSKQHLLRFQNYIMCESHRDKVDFYMKIKNNN